MVKYITLGNYNYKYKYIIIYIMAKLVFDYFLGDELFPDDFKIEYLRSDNFPSELFIFDIFKYLGILIFGLILYKLEIGNLLTDRNVSKSETNTESHNIELIFSETRDNINFSVKKFCITIIIYVINIKAMDIFYIYLMPLGCDFWMSEIVVIYFLTIKYFKFKSYIHQKVAMVIILIFSTLMKIIAAIFIYNNEENKEEHEILASPFFYIISIIGFILIYATEGYVFCKLNYYFVYKFISERQVLISLGFFGIIISLICSLFTNFIECSSNEISNNICKKYEDNNNNSLYCDNYEIFFKNIWRKGRTPFINCIYIFLILLKILFSIYENVFILVIIKLLNPMYLLATYSITYFIGQIISFIYYLESHNYKFKELLFNFLARFFAFLGTIIYLEIIELNFCGLNHYLKKNIELRARFESSSSIDYSELEIQNCDDDSNIEDE